MYLSHFGLKELPFGLTPDTEFIYSAQSHLEALNTLIVATESGEGFVKITGEVGTGKTLLCRRFLATLDDRYVTAYIPNPQLEPRAFLRSVFEELGAAESEMDGDFVYLTRRINKKLLELADQGKRVLLCLDEAQTMPALTLESMRLLSNLETEKRKLIQIALFGQPELDQLNRELKGQRQVAITASRAKSDFLARMSHELRSPLNAILGFSEIIADRVFGPEGVERYQDYARNIHDAGAHLLELINDILDISKVEAGELQLTLEPIELKELIKGSVQLMAPIAEKRGVQMVVDLGRSPLSLNADRRRLRQMG